MTPSHVIYDTLQSAKILHQSEIDAPIQYANNLISDMCEDMKKNSKRKKPNKYTTHTHDVMKEVYIVVLLIAVTFSVSLLLQGPGFSPKVC